MIKRIQRNLFPSIIALSALSVSASAAFYSVSGLSKLFAGATFEVIIMAGSLEVAKLVIASLLYQYWDTINKLLRTYLSIAAVVLVLITSMGIYGFLSAAYQETYQQLTVTENKISFLENKAKFYEDDVIRYEADLERISTNISTLSNAKATSIQVRDTTVASGIRSTVSTAELRLAQQRIQVEEENKKAVQAKREVAADSLQKFKLEILDIQNSSTVAGELGPLQYLSGLTGTPMDKIINILLLIIIFVFDPLAISLVVAANFAFDKANRKNLYNEYEDEVDEGDIWDALDDEEDINNIEVETEVILPDEARGFEPPKYEVTGSVPEGKQFNVAYDFNDWKVVDEEPKEEPIKIKKVLQNAPSRVRAKLTDGSERWISKRDIDDDNVIRYL